MVKSETCFGELYDGETRKHQAIAPDQAQKYRLGNSFNSVTESAKKHYHRGARGCRFCDTCRRSLATCYKPE